MSKLGLPYMGSKRSLAEPLIDFMLKENPQAKYFYDLFGGGGAMSFEAMQRPQIKQVFYNELNSGVVALLRDTLENGVTEKHYQWIDRDAFNTHKATDDWFGGLCKVVWSFGNQQESYLYGRGIEHTKYLAHRVVVDSDKNALVELSDIFGFEFPDYLADDMGFWGDLKTKRLRLKRFVRDNAVTRFDLEHLERLEHLTGLEITNKSFDEVEITTPPSETIIYLDTPYAGVKKYEVDFDINDVYKYMAKSEYKIYLSSYDSHLPCVLELDHRSTLSATNNSKKTKERLFSLTN